METIEPTKEQLNNMRILNNDSYESKILEYKEKYVIKYFKNHISKDKLENKRLKLIKIRNKGLADNIITKPLSLINVNGEFAAYLMKKENMITLKSVNSIDLLFELYANLFDKLEYLHNHGICICDLKPENILVPNAIFCDIDSMGVDELEPCYPDIGPNYAYKDQNFAYKLFVNERKKIDYLLLIYSFLNSLDNYRSQYESYTSILERLNFSLKTEKIIKKFIKRSKIKTIPNFSKILLLERNLYGKQL